MVNISFNIEYIILWQDTSFMDDLIASIATQTNKKNIFIFEAIISRCRCWLFNETMCVLRPNHATKYVFATDRKELPHKMPTDDNVTIIDSSVWVCCFYNKFLYKIVTYFLSMKMCFHQDYHYLIFRGLA